MDVSYFPLPPFRNEQDQKKKKIPQESMYALLSVSLDSDDYRHS